ncbi:signal peptidase I [Leptospira perolatii]|uniref:Signal peptidase I n=1 Tax=Leptospira perolatii TaxID=2023191 RepID=A0A2M9ZQC3_9LEPT|nr:signal peptidase I [Leptospira perolatii]PJZ70408.1 signal peptidase I [Leptospira perolatii]PJZ74244.1 signal peptidase I [Leptospira perolatii]
MKKDTIAIILNFFLYPIGYYYLKAEVRFWIFFVVALISSTVAAILNYLCFSFADARVALGVLVLFGLSLRSVIAVDTLLLSHRKFIPSSRAYFRWPHVLWFGPLAIFLFSVLSVPIEKVQNHFSTAKFILSSSMEPNFLINDYIFLTQIQDTIRRGDVVSFEYVENGRTKAWISRVVAIPGDTVEVKEGEIRKDGVTITEVTVNGKALEHNLSSNISWHIDTCPQNTICSELEFQEENAGRKYQILETNKIFFPILPRIKLGPDEYYLLGDNRDNSRDSRFIGTVNRKDINGRYLYTYFSESCPPTKMGDPCEVSRSPACLWNNRSYFLQCKIRTERIGIVVQ